MESQASYVGVSIDPNEATWKAWTTLSAASIYADLTKFNSFAV